MPDVLMPRLSDTMEEGTIARWLKHPGDAVQPGDVLAEIQTDKATMDLEAYDAGVLQRLLAEEGATVPIGQPIAVIGAEPAAGATGPGDSGPEPTATEPTATEPSAPAASPPGAAAAGPTASRVPVPAAPPSSPLARTLARRHGLDLSWVTGSGPGGRVVRADVEAAIAARAASPVAGPGAGAERPAPAVVPGAPGGPQVAAGEAEEVPLSTLRRITAERLEQSARVPHFDLTTVVDAGALLSLRAEVNRALGGRPARVSVTDLLVKACAEVLRAHPEVNSVWGGDKLLRYRHVNVGVAVAVPEGLVVPVVHDADQKPLRQVAAEAHDLAERARQGKLALDDISGGTFTISNLGMYGISHFTAVLNPPQAAILAVGAATPEPVVKDGVVVVATTLRLTLTVDHRALDGASAAQFLADLRSLLHDPVRLLV